MLELSSFFKEVLHDVKWKNQPRLDGAFVRRGFDTREAEAQADAIFYYFDSEELTENAIKQRWFVIIEVLNYNSQVTLDLAAEQADGYLKDIFSDEVLKKTREKKGLNAELNNDYIGVLRYKRATTSNDESSFFKIELEFELTKHVAC